MPLNCVVRLVALLLLGASLSFGGVVKAQETTPDFATWLEALKAEATAAGIRAEILEEAFAGVEPLPRVIELDRSQPEFTTTFADYIGKRVNEQRISRGKELLAEHAKVLDRVRAKYGVPPRFIVALWGLETNYGGYTGGFSVIAALATLAHDGRRSAYFREQLLAALRILDEGHITADAMQGSWAGAMGQSQFMPTSFTNYAVDFDGDGRRDIWGTHADVFASAANYLKQSGWRSGEIWGRRVALPAAFDESVAGLETAKSLADWQALGVRRADGSALPNVAGMEASVVLPGGAGGPAYLVYNNYRTIMRWNRSHFFATSVGLLADRLVSP